MRGNDLDLVLDFGFMKVQVRSHPEQPPFADWTVTRVSAGPADEAVLGFIRDTRERAELSGEPSSFNPDVGTAPFACYRSRGQDMRMTRESVENAALLIARQYQA